MFKETVAQFIKSIKGGLEMIVKQNEESIFLRGTDSSDVRKINAYPQSSATTKGVGGDIIICEEMARIQVFFLRSYCAFVQHRPRFHDRHFHRHRRRELLF